MKNKILFLFLLFCAVPSGFAQLKTHTFQEAEQLAIQNPKPIVVFIHTEWCTYCKMMENSTFKNKKIIATLNDNYYFVPFDAEFTESITFNNHTFNFQPTGTKTGIHELATALATINGQVVYPTLTILDSEKSIIFQQHSVIRAVDLLSILQKLK
ncbi:thioredoxin family protein [Flavobacterium frigidarium]|uniref:thioredoxin family protein n=1 Tax=Flavobacterium frigidarium TaxID=99286 RepID=UPI0030DD295A|tara:strand:- start:18397 stop:18861 length:465 start_codon:yes stop_codon:yes gene_type:complete